MKDGSRLDIAEIHQIKCEMKHNHGQNGQGPQQIKPN
jgi:hypothetical protein